MTTFKFSGNGASKALLRDVKGLIILDKNTAITGIKTLAGHQAYINPATTSAIHGTYINIDRGFDEKTKAAEMTTSNTGYNEKTKDYAPEFVAYGLISYSDYRTWIEADGKEFDFIPVLEDNKLIIPPLTGANQFGFCGRLVLTNPTTLPKAGGAEKAKYAEFTVIFDDVDQYKGMQVITPAFTRKELEACVPVGINIEVVTPYESTGGTVVIKATHRATGLPYAGFTEYTQWEVVSLTTDTGGAATAITATSANLGLYTVTFLNGAAKLTGKFEIQGVTITATHVTYLSNVLSITV